MNNKITFKNLTPHVVNILNQEKKLILSVPPEPTPARAKQTNHILNHVFGFPLMFTQYGATENLPAEIPNTILIVSALVRMANPGRLDLASPGELVRDAAGNPEGCIGLIVNLP